MKQKLIYALLPLLLVTGCQSTTETTESATESTTETTTENNSSPSEESQSSETPSNTETEAPSEPTIKTYQMTYENIPETTSGQYNNDFDFNVDDLTFHGDYLQRGAEKNIQMKKGVSYFSSTTSLKVKITIEQMSKKTDYGDFTGDLTLYVGKEMNPTEKVESFIKVFNEEKNVFEYEAEVNGFFSIKDESDFACYVNSVTFEVTF